MYATRLKMLVAICLPFQIAMAGGPAPKTPTAGDFVIHMVSEAPRVYETVCTAKDPAMKASFGKAISEYQAKVEKIGRSLLSLDLFSSLNKDPPPQEAIDALPEQEKSRLERIKDADASKDCPVFLRNIQNADPELLKVGISHSLSGIQGLIAGKKTGALK